jgi:HD superfamily phosphodiesterase
MDVLNFAHNIYMNELPDCPFLKEQEKVIYTAAILHDMCDKKYVNEDEGIRQIEDFLQESMDPAEIDMTKQIISTMSYSTVKKKGYPLLGTYQYAYHIVREADLLSAYNFDRCMIYHMQKNQKCTLEESFQNANELFENRVLKYIDDQLIGTKYGTKQSLILHNRAKQRIRTWKSIIRN